MPPSPPPSPPLPPDLPGGGDCPKIHGFGDCSEFNYCGLTATQYGNGECVRGRCVCNEGYIDSNCSQLVKCMYWDKTIEQFVAETITSSMPSTRNSVGCTTDHLTDFAGVLLFPPPAPRPTFDPYDSSEPHYTSAFANLRQRPSVLTAFLYLVFVDALLITIFGFCMQQCVHRPKAIAMRAYLRKNWRALLWLWLVQIPVRVARVIFAPFLPEQQGPVAPTHDNRLAAELRRRFAALSAFRRSTSSR